MLLVLENPCVPEIRTDQDQVKLLKNLSFLNFNDIEYFTYTSDKFLHIQNVQVTSRRVPLKEEQF